MINYKIIFTLCLGTFVLLKCVPNKVCSAYSSAFILDRQERIDFFSDFKKVKNSQEQGSNAYQSVQQSNNPTLNYGIDSVSTIETQLETQLETEEKKKSSFFGKKKATRKTVDESYIIASNDSSAMFFYVPKEAKKSNKNKYGIIGERIRKQKKLWRRVKREKVWPTISTDSLSIDSLLLQYDSLSTNKPSELLPKDSVRTDPYGFGKKLGIVNEDQIQYLIHFGKYLPKKIDVKAKPKTANDKTEFPDEAISEDDINSQLYDGFDNIEGTPKSPKYDENGNDLPLSKEEKKARKKAEKLKRKEQKRLEKENKKRLKKMEKERLKLDKSLEPKVEDSPDNELETEEEK